VAELTLKSWSISFQRPVVYTWECVPVIFKIKTWHWSCVTLMWHPVVPDNPCASYGMWGLGLENWNIRPRQSKQNTPYSCFKLWCFCHLKHCCGLNKSPEMIQKSGCLYLFSIKIGER
jgi:hypothetical protein